MTDIEQKAREITPVCLQCGRKGHVYTQCSHFFDVLSGLFGVVNILAPVAKQENNQ